MIVVIGVFVWEVLTVVRFLVELYFLFVCLLVCYFGLAFVLVGVLICLGFTWVCLGLVFNWVCCVGLIACLGGFVGWCVWYLGLVKYFVASFCFLLTLCLSFPVVY